MKVIRKDLAVKESKKRVEIVRSFFESTFCSKEHPKRRFVEEDYCYGDIEFRIVEGAHFGFSKKLLYVALNDEELIIHIRTDVWEEYKDIIKNIEKCADVELEVEVESTL